MNGKQNENKWNVTTFWTLTRIVCSEIWMETKNSTDEYNSFQWHRLIQLTLILISYISDSADIYNWLYWNIQIIPMTNTTDSTDKFSWQLQLIPFDSTD